MSNSGGSSSAGGGIGFCGLLAIVFIVLKLLGKITWSWIWVLSPLWIPAGIVICVLVVLLSGYILTQIPSRSRRK